MLRFNTIDLRDSGLADFVRSAVTVLCAVAAEHDLIFGTKPYLWLPEGSYVALWAATFAVKDAPDDIHPAMICVGASAPSLARLPANVPITSISGYIGRKEAEARCDQFNAELRKHFRDIRILKNNEDFVQAICETWPCKRAEDLRRDFERQAKETLARV